MGKSGFESREVAEVLATVHPWIRLVLRGYYVPALATAVAITRDAVIDLDMAAKRPSTEVDTFGRYVMRAAKRMPELHDMLAPDDGEASLDRLFEPVIAAAYALKLDPTSAISPIVDIMSTMDRAIAAVTMVAGELFVAVDGLLDPGGGMRGRVDAAIDRGHDLGRALSALLQVLNDFIGSDLRDVDLTAIPLGGVVWSQTTRWPPNARDRVMRDSVPIGPGVFAIRETAADAVPAKADRRDAWTVGRAEAEHMAQLWAVAGQAPEYPLIGSVVAEFDLGYVLTERLPEHYAPLSYPRWAMVDRETGDLTVWRPGGERPRSVEPVIERFRAWHAQRPPVTRTWGRPAHVPIATPSHVTYLRLPALHPTEPDRWIRACGIDEGDAAPRHHQLVGQFIQTLPPQRRPDRCAVAAAMSDALHTEDAARVAAGQPPITLAQARSRLFANAASLTYRLRGAGGPATAEPVPPCPSCELLVRYFSRDAHPAGDTAHLDDDLRLLEDWDRGPTTHGGPAVAADLDAAITVFRRLRQDGPTQEIRELGTDRLFEALVRRFRDEGNVADLDDVIEMREVDNHRIAQQPRTSSGPRRKAPSERWVEQAYRERAKITGSSVDATIAASMRWYSRRPGSDEPAFDIQYTADPDGYTVRAAKARGRSQPMPELAADAAQTIARLRAEPDLEQRVDLLAELVDALGGLEIATGSTRALDELINATELLIRALPEHDVQRRAVHRCGLGGQLYHRRQDAGGGPEDARRAFDNLEHAAGTETLETRLRIWSARIAAAAAASIDDQPAAARMCRLAIDLLPRLVPRHLSPSDHARLLTPMSGLVSEAATGLLRAGDPGGALELLEQGRGLLIGRALDARDGTTEWLRRIADGLATAPDPHADREPGQPSVVDQRRELGRAWEREVIRIRTQDGFDDYLQPLRIADLVPLAAGGPVVTIVVSGDDANALLLTTDGVDVVALPDLTAASLDEMVDTFWGVLPFAELSPDDEDATAAAQEPLRWVLARLWDTVAARVFERLGPTRRIWWVPTGMLATLPLHAAGDGADSVLDRTISSYTPTIKVLRASRSRARGHSDTASVVAVADTPGMPPLPRTRTEAFEVMRRFPAVARLDGPSATPAAVLAAVADSGWLHLACHATSNVRDPANCALHVHGGTVTAREVMSQRTSSGRLAYLSSCRTAMVNGSDVVDEMIHLGSAFQIAGFRHVVGTLWRVRDSLAAEVAGMIYQQSGLDEDRAPQALHDAVLRLRECYPLMPARWAPYVHLGG